MEWNVSYFIEITFIGFTLHEIKQCIVGHPLYFRLYLLYFTVDYTYYISLFKIFALSQSQHLKLHEMCEHMGSLSSLAGIGFFYFLQW